MYPGQTRCEYTPQTRDQYLIYTDKSLQAFSDSSCRQACTQERDFNCRSYSYLTETRVSDINQCLLSSDTQESAGGNAFQLATGALYAEKDCGRQPRPAGSGGGRPVGGLNLRPQVVNSLPQVSAHHPSSSTHRRHTTCRTHVSSLNR